MQEWKLREMETAAPKCSGGNCEKWKLRHNVAGVENAVQAAMDSQKNIYYEFSKFLPFYANVM